MNLPLACAVLIGAGGPLLGHLGRCHQLPVHFPASG